MKTIPLCLLALLCASCVSPVPITVNTYVSPPGVFVGVPLIPVEIGAQLKGSDAIPLLQAQSSNPSVGLRAAMQKEVAK